MMPIHLFSESRATVSSIRSLLRSDFELRVHHYAGRLPLRSVREGGCAVIDMDEPLGWWRAILAECIARPSLPIVLVTERPVARDIVWAVNLGAKDVVDRSADGDRLLQLLNDLAGTALAGAGTRAARQHRLLGLTRRQREILALASSGMPSKAIARSLAISKRTVDAHRSRMVRRLSASSFLELVREQIRQEVEAGA